MLKDRKNKGKGSQADQLSHLRSLPYREGSSMFVNNKKDNWSERSATNANGICPCDSTPLGLAMHIEEWANPVNPMPR